MAVYFSPKTMEVKKKWLFIFQVLKEKKTHQLKILYSLKISFMNKEEIRTLEKISINRDMLYLWIFTFWPWLESRTALIRDF